jgi:hypothetical protein
MRQAREEGSSWSQVGAALGMSRQAAYDFYRRRLDQEHEPVAPDSYDVARSRAALDENSND